MWGKADILKIKEMCKDLSDTVINSFTTCSNMNEVWTFFKRGCHLIIDDNVPHRMTSQRFTQPWINRDIRRLTRLKRRWQRRARRSNEQKDWEKYKALKKKTQKACRDGHDNYVNDILTKDSTNPKRYWNFIKSKKKDNTGMAPLKKDGLTFCDRQNQANIMGNQFSSVFTKEDTSNLPDLGPSNTQSAPPINVDPKGIQKLLKDLKPHKATGPDCIPARLLKTAADELAPGLAHLFQISVDNGKIPLDWKTALVTPVFKKGNRSDPGNYRPISLTSIACKILEHVIHSCIINHFERHDILTDCQHGFRKRRSCETQLIMTVDDLARGLNEKQQVDAVLLDFSKAFDKVPHQRLLLKLEHYGVRGNLLKWVEDFLSARTQEVVIDGTKSTPLPVSSGVPQGTVLGPLLFLAYINDMPEGIRSTVKLFADDSLVYRKISNKRDCEELQQDLDRLQEWEKKWQMAFNAEKCEVLCITNKKNTIQHNYLIHGQKLAIKSDSKYLGVTISSNLSWSKHVNNISKKANSTMAFLRRNIRPASQQAKSTAYKTFVRPTLEYASTVWSPHTDTDSNQLEMVQRRAARFVKSDYSRKSSVTAMRQDLCWDTLLQRRDQARLSMMYRIAHQQVDIPAERYLTPLDNRTRGHNARFRQIPTSFTGYQQSFFPRTIVLWNQLPQEAVSQSTLEAFQIQLATLTP